MAARGKVALRKLGPEQGSLTSSSPRLPTPCFIHCWGGNLDFWRFNGARISGAIRVILVDLPGHGKSDAPRRPNDGRYAGAIEAVLRDARVTKRARRPQHGVGVISRFYRDFRGQDQALVAVMVRCAGYRMLTRNADSDKSAQALPRTGLPETVPQVIDTMFPVAAPRPARARQRGDAPHTAARHGQLLGRPV